MNRILRFATCLGIAVAGAAWAQPRSTSTLARDDAWLQSIASHVRDTSSALAKASSAASAASAASAKAAACRACAPSAPTCACSVATLPELEHAASRVPAWDAAALPALRQLVVHEKLSVLPMVDASIVFDEARVTVSSGWLDATESLVRAAGLSRSLHADGCYGTYLAYSAQVMTFNADDAVKGGMTPARLAPPFDVFAEHCEALCKPLLSRTWPSPPLDVRAEVEASLVWWIGRELAHAAPAGSASADDRADKLLVALNLPSVGVGPIKALLRSGAGSAASVAQACASSESR